MSRELTGMERRAVKRVEEAIAAMPDTVALYFHGSTTSVMDCDADGRIVGVAKAGYPSESAALGSINTRRCAAGDF